MFFIWITLLMLSCVKGEENITHDLFTTSKDVQAATEWTWPWQPEIHTWFQYLNHSYFNLSAEPQEVWDGIYLAWILRTKESPYNFTTVNFKWAYYLATDWFKAEEMYLTEYAGTNKSMFACYPNAYGHVPEDYAATAPRGFWIGCGAYTDPSEYYWITRATDFSYVYKTSKPTIDIYLGLATIIFVVGITGNVLIIASILRNKEMKTPTNYFLLSLAVDDLIICAFFPFVQIHQQYLQPVLRTTHQGCVSLYYFEGLVFFCSIFHLTTVSFERFFAICFPMKVKTICTTRRAKILIPVLWIISAVVSIPRIFARWEGKSHNGYTCAWADAYMMTKWSLIHQSLELCLYLLPLCLIIHNYGRLSYTLISSMKRNAQLMEGNQNEENTRANEDYKRRMKVVKMLVTIVIIFFICWSPRIFWLFLKAEDASDGLRDTLIHISTEDSNNLTYITVMISYVNSIANGPVYYFTSNQFNMAFKRIVTCGRLGKEEKMTSMITQSSMAASTSFTEKPQVSSSTGGGAP